MNQVLLQVTWTNRVQTTAYVVLYDLTDLSDIQMNVTYTLTIENGWIDSISLLKDIQEQTEI